MRAMRTRTSTAAVAQMAERGARNSEVDGSIPVQQHQHGDVAQPGERLACNQDVVGSIPTFSTISSSRSSR